MLLKRVYYFFSFETPLRTNFHCLRFCFRVRQLKSLLNSSTDSSSDSSVSESDSDRRKRRRKRHKEDSKHERKSSRSPVDESRQKRKKKSKKLKKKKRKKSSKKVEWVDASTLPDRVKMKAEAADNVGVHGGVQIKTEKIDDGYMNAVIKTEPTDNNSMGADGASVCTTNVPNMKQECGLTGLHEHISSSNISIKGEPPWPKSSHIYEGAPSTAATSSNRDSGDGNVASETGSSHTTNDEERIRRLMLHVASQSKLSHSWVLSW